MNFEWIIGGLALLAMALVMKRLVEQGAFQTLLVSFTIVWSMIAALHFWNLLSLLLALLPGEVMSESRCALVAYWVGFLAFALPSVLLARLWLKGYITTFPPLVDGLITWVGALVSSVALFCLLIMSVAISAGSQDDFDCKKMYVRADLGALVTYVWVAQQLEGGDERTDFRDRLPATAQALFRR